MREVVEQEPSLFDDCLLKKLTCDKCGRVCPDHDNEVWDNDPFTTVSQLTIRTHYGSYCIDETCDLCPKCALKVLDNARPTLDAEKAPAPEQSDLLHLLAHYLEGDVCIYKSEFDRIPSDAELRGLVALWKALDKKPPDYFTRDYGQRMATLAETTQTDLLTALALLASNIKTEPT